MVEHSADNRVVPGSNPGSGIPLISGDNRLFIFEARIGIQYHTSGMKGAMVKIHKELQVEDWLSGRKQQFAKLSKV